MEITPITQEPMKNEETRRAETPDRPGPAREREMKSREATKTTFNRVRGEVRGVPAGHAEAPKPATKGEASARQDKQRDELKKTLSEAMQHLGGKEGALELKESEQGLIKTARDVLKKFDKSEKDGGKFGEKQAGLKRALEISLKAFQEVLGEIPARDSANGRSADGRSVFERIPNFGEGLGKAPFDLNEGVVVKELEELLGKTVDPKADLVETIEQLKAQFEKQLGKQAVSVTDTNSRREAKEAETPTKVRSEAKTERKAEEAVTKQVELQLQELTKHVTNLKIVMARLDLIQNRILQIRTLKELEENRDPLLVTESSVTESSATDSSTTGLQLVRASSAGEEKETTVEATPPPAGPLHEASHYVKAASDEAEKSDGGSVSETPADTTPAGSDFTGTSQLIKAQSHENDAETKKLDKLIDKMVKMASISIDLLIPTLFLLNVKSRKLTGAGANVMIKIFETADKKGKMLTSELENLSKTDKVDMASLAKFNNDLASNNSDKNIAMGFFKELLSDFQTMQELISGVQNSMIRSANGIANKMGQ